MGYVRGRAFTSRIIFESVEAAQQWLSRNCEGINRETGSIATGNKQEALRHDSDVMLHFPGDFGCFDMQTCSVDKQSTICVKGIHYSVPDTLVGQTVVVQIYSERLRIYNTAHKKVAEHERSYDKGTWHFDISHYLDTLIRKPGSLKGSMALKQMP